jgi:hypothetical protein
MRRALLLAMVAFGAVDEPPQPWLDRVFPLSGQRGTTVRVELHGKFLAKTDRLRFDTPDLEWLTTEKATEKLVTGTIRIARDAALGPHAFHADGPAGPSNSRLFNVSQFASVLEVEPNDTADKAQPIRLEPQSLQGYMKGLVDVDVYQFHAGAGERWTFDLRSLEYGTHLESGLTLLDEHGKRVAGNEDRDDYDESPFLEHVFARDGRYLLKLDQYRGPQGVNCAQNCGYSLEISQLPRVNALDPLGARRGHATRFALRGTALDRIREVYLLLARQAEHYRMTYPFTMPIRFAADPPRAPRIEGQVTGRSPEALTATFTIPADAELGLWRLWVRGAGGDSAAFNLEIGDAPEFDESTAARLDWRAREAIINGRLARDNEEDTFSVDAEAGKPLRFWTLAAQLGLPFIDTVIELRDLSGEIVASHDDVMTGQGTPVGNPDSSLVYVPAQTGRLSVTVRDRIGRGGPSFAYRLKIRAERAGFQLLAAPEHFTVKRGDQGEMTLLLIREPGFEGEVAVSVEGLPEGVTATAGKFRADQEFGPSADGDNMIIPELPLRFTVAAGATPGTYPIPISGTGGIDNRTTPAHSSLWIGPPRFRNDIRRPRPAVTLTIVE